MLSASDNMQNTKSASLFLHAPNAICQRRINNTHTHTQKAISAGWVLLRVAKIDFTKIYRPCPCSFSMRSNDAMRCRYWFVADNDTHSPAWCFDSSMRTYMHCICNMCKLQMLNKLRCRNQTRSILFGFFVVVLFVCIVIRASRTNCVNGRPLQPWMRDKVDQLKTNKTKKRSNSSFRDCKANVCVCRICLCDDAIDWLIHAIVYFFCLFSIGSHRIYIYFIFFVCCGVSNEYSHN